MDKKASKKVESGESTITSMITAIKEKAVNNGKSTTQIKHKLSPNDKIVKKACMDSAVDNEKASTSQNKRKRCLSSNSIKNAPMDSSVKPYHGKSSSELDNDEKDVKDGAMKNDSTKHASSPDHKKHFPLNIRQSKIKAINFIRNITTKKVQNVIEEKQDQEKNQEKDEEYRQYYLKRLKFIAEREQKYENRIKRLHYYSGEKVRLREINLKELYSSESSSKEDYDFDSDPAYEENCDKQSADVITTKDTTGTSPSSPVSSDDDTTSSNSTQSRKSSIDDKECKNSLSKEKLDTSKTSPSPVSSDGDSSSSNSTQSRKSSLDDKECKNSLSKEI